MREQIGDMEVVTLDLNYRSCQKVLDVSSTVLGQGNNQDATKTPLVSFKNTASERPRLRFREFELDLQETKWIAREVQKLVTEEKVPVEDIVILTRSGFSLDPLMKELEACELKAVQIGSSTVAESQTANLVLTILRMLHFPQRNLFVWQLLRAHKLFITPTGLKTAVERAQNVPLLEVLQSHQLWLSKAKSSSIDEFLEMFHTARNMVTEEPQSLDALLSAAKYVIKKLEYKQDLFKKLSRSGYAKRMKELDDVFEYFESLRPELQAQLENSSPERTCLDALLHSSSLHSVSPERGVSSRIFHAPTFLY